MKRLIINSDDYGRSPEISRGIREAHLHGVVTSTTCMMNIPTTPGDIVQALQETPSLGMGVHLVLTMGTPLSTPEWIPSLVDENGHFFKNQQFFERRKSLNAEQAKREWREQIEAFIRAAGKKPTHLDSHHHSSYYTPDFFRQMLELAREYECAIRYPFTSVPSELEDTYPQSRLLMEAYNPRRPDVFFANFYDESATREELLNILQLVGEGTSEIMCHPGYVDEDFAKESPYNFPRERELKILVDPSIKEEVRLQGITLVNFADL